MNTWSGSRLGNGLNQMAESNLSWPQELALINQPVPGTLNDGLGNYINGGVKVDSGLSNFSNGFGNLYNGSLLSEGRSIK